MRRQLKSTACVAIECDWMKIEWICIYKAHTVSRGTSHLEGISLFEWKTIQYIFIVHDKGIHIPTDSCLLLIGHVTKKV